MKVMDIRVSIDVSNDAHREALNTFMEALGGKGVVVTEEAPAKKKSRKKPKPEPEVEEDEEDEEEGEETEEERKKREAAERRAKRKAKREAEAAAAKKAAEEDEDEDEDEGEDEGEDEQEIDHAVLREMTSIHSKKHRKAIKDKLAELGAKNVSALDEEDFQEYFDFLTEL